jgi:hypothetical protein
MPLSEGEKESKRLKRRFYRQRSKDENRNGLKLRLVDVTTLARSKLRSDTDQIVHDRGKDLCFQQRVLTQLQNRLHLSQSQNTWGFQTVSVIKELLDIAQPPITNLDPYVSTSEAEALFLRTKEARALLTSGTAINVPIFAQNQQEYTWSASRRPISQLLDYYSNLEETVHLNDSSLPYSQNSFTPATIADVKLRFAENRSRDNAWNVLDLDCPLPETYGICPKFLQTKDCDLLSQIKGGAIRRGSARRAVVDATCLKQWRDVERWILLAEPGAHTAPHQDSNGYGTFITVSEGEVGFGWLSRPTDQDLEDWSKDLSRFRGGSWRYVVLRPRQTVYFEPGTVHWVFRMTGDGRQTMAIGGHVLRCSSIAKWARVVAMQLEKPKVANEKITKTAASYLLAVAGLVKQAENVGALETFGGEETVARFRQEAEVVSILRSIP